MSLFNHREFINPDRRRPQIQYGCVLRLVPGNAGQYVEWDRAPDSAGSPGTWANIARAGPYPLSGAFFIDPRPNDGATWWYRARHVGDDVTAGAYVTAVSGVARRLDDPHLVSQSLATSVFTRTADIKPLAVTTATIAAEAVTPAESQSRFRCRLRNSAGQALTDLTPLTLLWDTEDADVGTLHSTASNTGRITVPTGGNVGFWILNVRIIITPGDGSATLELYKNGATLIAITGTSGLTGNDGSMGLTAFVAAPTATDYFTAVVTPTGITGSRNVGPGQTFFEAIHVW